MSISQVREERALQVYFPWDECIPVSLHPYCCSEGTALAWDLLDLPGSHIQVKNHWCSSLPHLHPV